MEVPHRFSLDVQEQCKSEEVEAKRWMDRASRYLIEGRHESAIQLLQKTESVFPNCKNLPELTAVTQVCYAATWRACHCARPYTRKLPDWYHVLKVDERADFDTIKKRYRQLALLLHPDKNKHANSEGAFKTITEAYACLSDKEKRDIFNLERRRSFCVMCSRKAQQRAAGNVSSRPGVKTPQTPAVATPAAESDSLQNLRERANSTVNTLERDWSGKTTKWMQNLASVRQRYRNVGGDSPARAGMESSSSSLQPEQQQREEHVRIRSKVPSSPILPDGIPEAATKLDFNAFDLRRTTTTTTTTATPVAAAHDDSKEETIDVLLKRLRAERSAAAREFESPLSKEFGVHARTPEAAHLMRPLSVGKTRRSSSVDYKCEGGSLYSSWMPKGRCLSRKAPLSPTKVRRFASSVHVDRVVPRTIFPSSEPPQKGAQSNTAVVDPVRVSSSVRLESLYPTSPIHHKDNISSYEPARTSLSVRLEKRDDGSFSFVEHQGSATAARSSSVRVESICSPSPMQERDVKASPTLETSKPSPPPPPPQSARSSSVRVENVVPDFTVQQWSRSIARTASGSWTNAVKTHPEFFDDVYTPGSPAIRKGHVLKPIVSPNEAAATLKSSSSRVSGLLSEQSQRRLQRGSTRSFSHQSENLAPRVLNRAPASPASPAAAAASAVAENTKQGVRPPLGAMSENLSSFSSKTSQDRKDTKVTLSSLEKGRASRLVQLQDMERKQKSDAMNGILERLKVEAKTVAATLDRLRDNVGAENMGRPERVY